MARAMLNAPGGLHHLKLWMKYAVAAATDASKGDALCNELSALMQRVSRGDRDSAISRHRSRNKMLPRERISSLLDPGYEHNWKATALHISWSTIEAVDSFPSYTNCSQTAASCGHRQFMHQNHPDIFLACC